MPTTSEGRAPSGLPIDRPVVVDRFVLEDRTIAGFFVPAITIASRHRRRSSLLRAFVFCAACCSGGVSTYWPRGSAASRTRFSHFDDGLRFVRNTELFAFDGGCATRLCGVDVPQRHGQHAAFRLLR